MASELEQLKKDVARLASCVALLQAEMERLASENKRLTCERDQLKQTIAALLKRIYGARSEKLDPNQLLLDLGVLAALSIDDSDDDEPPPPPRRRKQRGKAVALPENLPEERTVIDPEEVLANPDAYECIGEVEHVELDVNPMRVFKRVTVRRKYRLKDRSVAPVIAPAPKQIIPNSKASAGLLAYIVESKYVDHLPLYRQEQIFRRYGVELGRKRMSSWIGQVGDALRTIYDEMKREMFAGGYLQVDETPVKYLSPGNGRTKQGYLWAYLSPGRAILFDWNTGRGAGCLRPMLEGFEGRVQCDGYAAYTAYNDWRIANKLTRLPLHACWAHARRKFVEARGVPLADEVLLEIQKLYRVEDKLREGGVSVEQRRIQRSEHSKPAIDQIESLMSQASHVLPQSQMGKAVGYTRSLWPKLTSYIDHGQVEIDNNLVENAIRPTALGRKNYMFFGSAEAGQASAIIYSVVQTCRMLEINVRDYLVDVFNRLPYATANEAREMTPAKWKLVLEHQAATNAA